MMSHWIKELQSSDSRLHKEDVIKQVLELAILGDTQSQMWLDLVTDTYNPYVTYGIKIVEDVASPPSGRALDSNGYTNPWPEFCSLLKNLQMRTLTGNSARDAIAEISTRFLPEEWNLFCAPVLRKDIRCGISDKTLNKVLGKTRWKINTFGCQLATNCEDRPEMRGVKRLEPKLDGVRVLMVVTKNGATSYSRNGKIFENFSHIEQEIVSKFDELLTSSGIRNQFKNGIVFDGEVVGNSFNELMRQARRKTDARADDSVYHIFDILPFEDHVRGYWNAQLRKRINILENMRGHFLQMSSVKLLEHIDVDLDVGPGRDQFQRYCRDKVEQGYEGVMIKDTEAPYECKRNTFWMKYKPTITVDLEVVDVEEGTGRNRGRMGALVCRGTDEGRQIAVNCGSGFSDSDRDQFWADRDLLIGQTVEILCDVVSQNQDGTYSLRFPRFVRFRDDK